MCYYVNSCAGVDIIIQQLIYNYKHNYSYFNKPENLPSTEPAKVCVASSAHHVVAASVLLYHCPTGGAKLHVVM